jgi:hypothetical protein
VYEKTKTNSLERLLQKFSPHGEIGAQQNKLDRYSLVPTSQMWFSFCCWAVLLSSPVISRTKGNWQFHNPMSLIQRGKPDIFPQMVKLGVFESSFYVK